MNVLISNEAEYLAEDPDVTAAVKDGNLLSDCWHYEIYGKGEGAC
jgi:hypothetical protein